MDRFLGPDSKLDMGSLPEACSGIEFSAFRKERTERVVVSYASLLQALVKMSDNCSIKKTQCQIARLPVFEVLIFRKRFAQVFHFCGKVFIRSVDRLYTSDRCQIETVTEFDCGTNDGRNTCDS